MKRHDVKSQCPLNFTLEIFGDPWSLLIVRSMLTYNAQTYSDFLKIQERIGTSVLAERLLHLEKNGILVKRRDDIDKRKAVYLLTEAGLDLIPLVYEMMKWGSYTSPHPRAAAAWFKALELDRAVVLNAWRNAARLGSAFYVGQDSVLVQLDL